MSQYTKEGDLYYFGSLLMGDKVGICLDYKPTREGIRGTLLKHGVPELTHDYFEKIKAAFYLHCADKSISSDLFYIEGPFDVDELNKSINNTGYVAVLYEKFLAAHFSNQDQICQII